MDSELMGLRKGRKLFSLVQGVLRGGLVPAAGIELTPVFPKDVKTYSVEHPSQRDG